MSHASGSVARVARASFRRPGRLVPPAARRLSARCLALGPGESVAWHSTQRKEELLLCLEGRMVVEVRRQSLRKLALTAGQCLFIPEAIRHRVVNPSRRQATRYCYVTGRAMA